MPVFRCPTCREEIDADKVFALLDDLANPFLAPPQIECDACHASLVVSQLTVEGAVFANVVLRFWNWWPLKPSFIEDVAKTCGAQVTVIYHRV